MLILASKSPQRRQILEQIGIEFEVVDSAAEEIEAGEPRDVVVANALLKARAGAAARELNPGDLALGADTVIALEGEVIGKPPDADAAKAVMRRLAGREHEVLGGIAVIGGGAREGSSDAQAGDGGAQAEGGGAQVEGGGVNGAHADERCSCVATRVRFRPLTDAEIDRYVATEEWRDRSGGYAIQRRGATLVERIEGDYLNIVGLSVVELLRLAPELRR